MAGKIKRDDNLIAFLKDHEKRIKKLERQLRKVQTSEGGGENETPAPDPPVYILL